MIKRIEAHNKTMIVLYPDCYELISDKICDIALKYEVLGSCVEAYPLLQLNSTIENLSFLFNSTHITPNFFFVIINNKTLILIYKLNLILTYL